MGIFFAFLALFSWGLGDFLIQKSTRRFGGWQTLFYIEILGVIALFPFVWKELPSLTAQDYGLLITASVVILFAALFNFEALKVGKISIIDPVYALEVPVTILLSTFIINEILNTQQTILIILLMAGIFLISTKSLRHLKNIKFERGVLLALIGTTAMGFSNFIFGVGARDTSALMINWFTGIFITIVCFLYLLSKGRIRELGNAWQHKRLVFGVSFFDNLAWISYSISATYIPIAIATGISESYIGLAALLGLVINKEKMVFHQWLGLFILITATVILAITT